MEGSVDISFACLPLRSVGRLDVPMDASGIYRIRYERLRSTIEEYGLDRTYYLYDAHCTFRLANSEIEGMLRFNFEGIVRTDAGDAITEEVKLETELVSETCGGVPEEVQQWLHTRIERAVALEFDRFISAGQLGNRTEELGQLERLSDLEDFSV